MADAMQPGLLRELLHLLTSAGGGRSGKLGGPGNPPYNTGVAAFRPRIMTSNEDIRRRIVELEVEHRDLDAVIDLLVRDGLRDELQLRRLKKRKLQLKDHITLLKMQLVPDIPA